MCPVASTFIGLLVTGVFAFFAFPLLVTTYDRVRGWMKSLPRTNSFGPGANVRRCSCHKMNFGGGPG